MIDYSKLKAIIGGHELAFPKSPPLEFIFDDPAVKEAERRKIVAAMNANFPSIPLTTEQMIFDKHQQRLFHPNLN